jgi:hypothetical protein
MIWMFLLNELMALLTIFIVFPGMFDEMDGFTICAMFFIISFTWPIFLAVCPFAFLVMYLSDDLTSDYWTDSFPWKFL